MVLGKPWSRVSAIPSTVTSYLYASSGAVHVVSMANLRFGQRDPQCTQTSIHAAPAMQQNISAHSSEILNAIFILLNSTIQTGFQTHQSASTPCRGKARGFKISPVGSLISEPVWFTLVRSTLLRSETGTSCESAKDLYPYWRSRPSTAWARIGARSAGAMPHR